MFEDSLVESQISHVSSGQRWTALASITFQCAIGATLVVIPMLHPERLVLRMPSPQVLVPVPPKPPLRIERVQTSSAPSSTASISSVARTVSTRLFPSTDPVAGDAPPATFTGMNMSDGIPAALSIGIEGHGTRVSVAPTPAASKPVRVNVSSGVSAGLLMAPIRPIYPVIAKAARVQGTVVVTAVISRTGRIESLRVISGPAMLQTAALEAIRAARYQPYRLNGEPTEVETTITVNFRMEG
jgi:protein TonB